MRKPTSWPHGLPAFVWVDERTAMPARGASTNPRVRAHGSGDGGRGRAGRFQWTVAGNVMVAYGSIRSPHFPERHVLGFLRLLLTDISGRPEMLRSRTCASTRSAFPPTPAGRAPCAAGPLGKDVTSRR